MAFQAKRLFYYYFNSLKILQGKALDRSITKPSPSRIPDTSGIENHLRQISAYVNW